MKECFGAPRRSANCAHRCIRLPNDGVGGCSGGPRAPEISAWEATRAAGPCVLPVGPDRLPRHAHARRPAGRHALPAGAGRAGFAPGSDTAAIAADLKAVFGDAAGFCAHIDDKGAPSPQASVQSLRRPMPALPDSRPGCGVCPARRPDAAAKGQRGRVAGRAAPDFGAFSACPAQSNRARAPPLSV
jgi:hypothetical protein